MEKLYSFVRLIVLIDKVQEGMAFLSRIYLKYAIYISIKPCS